MGTPSLTLTPQSVKTFRFTWLDVAGETEYRLLESPNGVMPLSVVATLAANTTSYELIVPLFRRLGAQYALQACNGSTCSSSQPVTVTGALAGAVGYFKASNTGGDDSFGISIALSADGTTLAVGASGEASSATGIGGNQADNSAIGSGAVFVFSRSGTTWLQQAYVKASNSQAGDAFGWSLALSADGDTLAVGAPSEDSNASGLGGNQADNSANDSGAAYIFSRTGTTWSQQAYVKASNTEAGDAFGGSIALSTDGSTLAVSSIGEDSNASGVGGTQTDNSATFSGATYVFLRSGSAWSQQGYLKASNTGALDSFGKSLAISSDGNTLAVGGFLEDSNATGLGGNQADNSASNSGAVYVFVRSGTTWSQQAYVKASNAEAGDYFGITLGLSGDGVTLAVGAVAEDSSAAGLGGSQADNSASNSGAVYVFVRSGTAWSQQAYVKASNTDALDAFGESVALSADGNTLAVGAARESSNATGVGGNQADNTAQQSGAVYVFERNASAWSQRAYLKAANTEPSDSFGVPVRISGDGSTLAVGALSEASSATGVGGNQNDNTATSSGAVYLY